MLLFRGFCHQGGVCFSKGDSDMLHASGGVGRAPPTTRWGRESGSVSESAQKSDVGGRVPK